MVKQTDRKDNTALMHYLENAKSKDCLLIGLLLTGAPLDENKDFCFTDECKKTANVVINIENKKNETADMIAEKKFGGTIEKVCPPRE